MGTRLTPAPVSLPPETADVDDSWADLVVDASGNPVRRVPREAVEDPDVFDRPTTIPEIPPSLFDLARPSDPISPHLLPTVSPEPHASFGGSPMPEEARKKTVPEPLMERYLARVEAGERNSEPMMVVADESESHSPLDLVETYRRSVANMPAVRGPEEPQNEKSRDSGNLQDMQDRYAVGDFTGALIVAESLLDANPENEDAKRYAQSCREVLTQMYAARIGPMDQVATVAVPPDQITWLSLDHRAGFLLSLVDGVSSIEEILDVSGMTRLDALRIMYTLVQQNVIALGH